MNESTMKIKRVIENERGKDARPIDPGIQAFIGELEKDARKTLQDKYGGYVDFESLETKTELDIKAAMCAQEIRTKGYAYDSLCLRYKEARFAQARAEVVEDKRNGWLESAATQRAQRDFLRFCEILDDVIGAHD